MNIGIDARIVKTGIGRYTNNLITEIAKCASPEDTFVVFLRKADFDSYTLPDERFKKVLADFPPYSFKEQIAFPFLLMKHKLDLIHFTNFNIPLLWLGRYVLTIHDLIHMSHSTFGSSTRNYLYYLFKKLVYSFAIKMAARRANVVFVPSKATKDDVVHYLGCSEERVVVTYEGADEFKGIRAVEKEETESEAVLIKYGINSPFLLYVATMYPHKNHTVLFDAMKDVLAHQPDLKLVLVGKVDYFSKKLKDQVDRSELKNSIIFTNFMCEDGYVPDNDLKVLYENADVYVFPSLKEGFGIPILEAQAYGLPVLAADTSCLPEIGGDGALYFNVADSSELATQIVRVLNNEDLREDLKTKGYKNLERFSWTVMAEQSYEKYKMV